MAQLRDVVRVTAKKFGVSQKDLRDPKKRAHDLTAIRNIAFYLALECTDASGTTIANYFGKKRNSSVFNARRKIQTQLEKGVMLGDVVDLAGQLGKTRLILHTYEYAHG